MKLTIFFSWQMSTLTKYNKYFILDCIKKSVKKLKTKPELKGIDFIIQEGVTKEPGSVQVASRIVDERIPNCDIFIADLSVVNHVGKKTQFIKKLIRDKYKPFQNNNVMYEYGIAYDAIGEERIIGVLNNVYGSPNTNPSNIPFDLRHIRFPIEYSYSPKHDKTEAQTRLVSDLTGAIKGTAIFAIQHQKDKHRPLSTWQDWGHITNTTQKFHENERVTQVISQIKKGVQNPNQSIRLVGLSGLGKTRILFETFKPNPLDSESNLLSSRVLYLNCNNHSNLDYENIFTRLRKMEEKRVIILDNCSIQLHRQLLEFINNKNNLLSLVTIDSSPEEIEQDKIGGVNYIKLRKEELSSIVDNILKEDFSSLDKNSRGKIKEFSQGIPLMAVLIGDSVKKGEKFIGRLDDKELLNKLLGEKGQDQKTRTILKSFSIFSFIGVEDELKPQIDFIATNKNITSLSENNQVIINEFHETYDYFLKREIFEKKGRLVGLRPFPLSMYLAQEWLEPCTPERLLGVIQDISKLSEPHRSQLSEAIAEQMKYLGYNDKAITIIDKITGVNSPFDNAEVLNSHLGSRLFRSFVEVNPLAISNNLSRNFSHKTKEELLKIGPGRRNLIWVLEKLCFDKRTFNESTKTLFAFAVSENERWSNNATGQLLHLFKLYLSGTEANLQERWNIIEWGLAKNDEDYYRLSIQAMLSGLSFGHFSRIGDSETQGSKKLIDYEPTHNEIEEYWTKILNKLTQIIKSNDSYSQTASDGIANKIRTICKAGHAKVIIPIVKEISLYSNNRWDEALKELKSTKKYVKLHLTDDLIGQIDDLITSLTGTDFKFKYINFSSLYHLDNESSSSNKMIVSMKKLADEFVIDYKLWEDNLTTIYSTHQLFSYYFGVRVYEQIKDDSNKIKNFLDLSLKTISKIGKEHRQVSVFGGFIAESNNDLKQGVYNLLIKDENLNYLLFYLISIDSDGKSYYNYLFELINNQKCTVDYFKVFNYGNSLQNCTLKELEEFAENLFSYGDIGYVFILNIYFNLFYDGRELKPSLHPVFKKCIIKLGFNKKISNQIENYKFTQIVKSILSSPNETEFAKSINKQILTSVSWESSQRIYYSFEEVYEILITKYFNDIWQDISDALLSQDDEYIKFFELKNIIGSHIGGLGGHIGILFNGNLDTIFEWCKSNQPLAPIRLAQLVPIFKDNEYSSWHPFTQEFINEFGHINEVLQNLSINMGNYSWGGSIIPLLEGKKNIFLELKNHRNLMVSEWAVRNITRLENDIRIEQNKDEENS